MGAVPRRGHRTADLSPSPPWGHMYPPERGLRAKEYNPTSGLRSQVPAHLVLRADGPTFRTVAQLTQAQD